ncbi:MAG: hypothetical protein WAM04_02380 [Candidatus Sulfotelmatobacter sp.]
MKRTMLQIATILSISALVAAQSGNQPPAPPPTGALIAPQGWVPQNPPAQPNGQPASVKPSQKKSAAAQPHPKAATPAKSSAPKN